MKKAADYIAVSAFFVIVIMFAAYTLVMGRHGSESEKADSSDIRHNVQTYVSNNFPLSSNWKSLRTTMFVMTGKKNFDNIYILKDRLVEITDFDKDRLDKNISQINDFSENTDTPVYVMLAPTAAGIYSVKLPAYASNTDQREMIDNIYYDLDSRIDTIDTFFPMYSARNNYVYYRTDRKWTSFGAYFAYADGIKELGFEPVVLSNYDQEYTSNSYYGGLYSELCYNSIGADRVNIFRSKYKTTVDSVELYREDQVLTSKSVYFRSALKTADKTAIFLQGDNFTKATVKTTAEDAPKLLIIKGSYANTLVPFLTPHYSEITLVDPDKLKEEGKTLSDVADTSAYDQILFMYDCDQFADETNFDLLK